MHRRLLLAAWVVLIPLVATVHGDEATYKGKTAAKWVEQLKSNDFAARKEAVEAMPRLGPDAKAAIPLLLDSINDKDPYYRNLVVTALGALGKGDERVGTALARLVMAELGPDVEQGQRLQTGPSFYMAAAALSRLGPDAKGALPIVKDGIRRRNHLARAAIVKIIARFGPEAVPVLQEAILDPSADVGNPAMLALTALGPKAKEAIPTLRETLQKNRDPNAVTRATRVLSAIGEEALPALLEGAKNPNPKTARPAIVAIGSMKAKSAIPVLGELLADPQVGGEAGRALGAMGADAFPVLLAGAKKDDSCLNALRGLQLLGPGAKEALPTVLEYLKSGHRDKVPAAASVIDKIGEAAVPALVESLKDPDQRQAASVLHGMGSRKPEVATAAIPLLINVLDGLEPVARERAAGILGGVGFDRTDTASLARIVKALRKVEKMDADDKVRKAASNALNDLQRAASSFGQKLPE